MSNLINCHCSDKRLVICGNDIEPAALGGVFPLYSKMLQAKDSQKGSFSPPPFLSISQGAKLDRV